MGKINGCLKCLFVFFNVLFAILGCLLCYLSLKVTAFSHQVASIGGPSLSWVWVFSIGVLGISCLGIFAGISEKPIALKIFAGFMVCGMIIMMIFGIIVVVERNKTKAYFDSGFSELAKSIIEDEDMRELLEGLQTSAQCCGVVSASDWGDEVPQSCKCMSSGGYGSFGIGAGGCKPKPQGTRGPDQIYRKTCSDLIFWWVDLIFKIFMGFFFGFAVTALLGLLVTLLMIHQVKRHDSSRGLSIPMKGY